MRRQGRGPAGLLDHLKRQHRNYDAVVFFGLDDGHHGVRPAGAAGAQRAAFRTSIWKPTLRLGLWAELLLMPRALGLLSTSERRILHHFVARPAASRRARGDWHRSVAAAHLPPASAGSIGRGRPRGGRSGRTASRRSRTRTSRAEERPSAVGTGSTARFASTAAASSPDNGCQEMLEYFDGFASTDGNMSLVLMGVKMMRVRDERIPAPGRHAARARADDRVRSRRRDDCAGARRPARGAGARKHGRRHACARRAPATRQPWRIAAAPTPACSTRTARSSSRRCGSWRGSPDLRDRLGEAGRRYVDQHYRWDAVRGADSTALIGLRVR